MDSKAHWETVYRNAHAMAPSWHQLRPTRSLELLVSAGAGPDRAIIDVGGGDSSLAAELHDLGVGRITVLDLSAVALERARERLGARADEVAWLEADVTRALLPECSFDLWHDRAVFHFLTDAHDRARYIAAMTRALRPGGTVIIATFAVDGPARCSGLEVARYSPESLAEVLGPAFRLVRGFGDVHVTPAGGEQRFTWAVFSFGDASAPR